ncbi:MAG: cytochrome c biogenesis protein CcdA [bacterium]
MITVDISVFVAFIGGVLAFFSPCVLPVIPTYLSYLAGVGSRQQGNKKLGLSALLFSLGFGLVFVLLGLGASVIGQTLAKHRLLLEKIGGVFVVLFGLHVLEFFKNSSLYREKRLALSGLAGRFHYFNSFLVGVTFGFGWTPCIGPLLATILILASVQGTVGQGVLLLVVFTLGLILPFMAISLFADKLLVRLREVDGVLAVIQKIAGWVLVILGVLLLAGWWRTVTGAFIQLFPWMVNWQL